MRSTCIAGGKEVIHRKSVLPPGYKTPSKSAKFAKKRARLRAQGGGDVEDRTSESLPEPPQKIPKVRTLKGASEAAERKARNMGGGGIYRMKNHR
jgi:hypothetical protein